MMNNLKKSQKVHVCVVYKHLTQVMIEACRGNEIVVIVGLGGVCVVGKLVDKISKI
jgi:hypothetical protein